MACNGEGRYITSLFKGKRTRRDYSSGRGGGRDTRPDLVVVRRGGTYSSRRFWRGAGGGDGERGAARGIAERARAGTGMGMGMEAGRAADGAEGSEDGAEGSEDDGTCRVEVEE